MSPEAKAFGQQPAYPPTMIDGLRYEGMTIHQRAAIAAMQGLCADGTNDDELPQIARTSVATADALCEALAKEVP